MVDWMQRVDTGPTELRELNDLSLETKIDATASRLEGKIDAITSGLESKMDVTLARHRADLIKWAFVFWVTALVAILAVAHR